MHLTLLGLDCNANVGLLLCAQTAGNALRFFVYDVLYEGRLIRDPSYAPALSRSRRSLGVAAAFIVSGLMHEHMYMFAPRERHTTLLSRPLQN